MCGKLDRGLRRERRRNEGRIKEAGFIDRYSDQLLRVNTVMLRRVKNCARLTFRFTDKVIHTGAPLQKIEIREKLVPATGLVE